MIDTLFACFIFRCVHTFDKSVAPFFFAAPSSYLHIHILYSISEWVMNANIFEYSPECSCLFDFTGPKMCGKEKSNLNSTINRRHFNLTHLTWYLTVRCFNSLTFSNVSHTHFTVEISSQRTYSGNLRHWSQKDMYRMAKQRKSRYKSIFPAWLMLSTTNFMKIRPLIDYTVWLAGLQWIYI